MKLSILLLGLSWTGIALAQTPTTTDTTTTTNTTSPDPNTTVTTTHTRSDGPPHADAPVVEEKKKDEGRGTEFLYAYPEVGFTAWNMSAFDENSLSVKESKSSGVGFGLNAGIRLAILTAGVRVRTYSLSSLNLWQLNAAVGIHIPIGNWDPYISVYGGYSFTGKPEISDVTNAAVSQPDITLSGANVGLQFGVDYYVASFFSIGGDVGLEGIYLHRPPLPLPAGATLLDPNIVNDPLYQNSGSSAGYGFGAFLHAGFHL